MIILHMNTTGNQLLLIRRDADQDRERCFEIADRRWLRLTGQFNGKPVCVTSDLFSNTMGLQYRPLLAPVNLQVADGLARLIIGLLGLILSALVAGR